MMENTDKTQARSIHKLAAIMFTDIVGYTSVMESDEELAFDLLEKNRVIHQRCINKHNGTLLKELGDGNLVMFSSLSDSVQCSLEIMKNVSEIKSLNLKIAIHMGEIKMEGSDIFGNGVNLASRIVDMANAGQVLISQEVFNNIKNKPGIFTVFRGKHRLKNIKDFVDLYEISDKEFNKEQKSAEESESSEATKNTILISKFKSLRPGSDTDFLAFSLPESIATSLSTIRNLTIQLDFSEAYYNISSRDFINLYQERKTRTVLTGSIVQSGNKVRVVVYLYRLPDGKLLWNERTEAVISDLFQLEDEVVHRILYSLQIRLTDDERQLLDSIRTDNPKIHSIFLKANQLSYQESEWEQARDLYNQCLDEEPVFVPALVRMARCDRLFGKFSEKLEQAIRHFAYAESNLQHALRLQPEFDHAHSLYAQLEVDLGRSMEAMKRLYQRTQKHSNNPILYSGLVLSFRFCGLLEQSIEADRKAREFDPRVLTSVGHSYWLSGEYERAADFITGDIGYLKGISLAALSRTREAIETLKENESIAKRPSVVSYLASLRYALQSDKKRSLENLTKAHTPYIDGEALYYLTRTYAFLEEKDTALELFRKVIELGFYPYNAFRKDEWLQSLQDNSDFKRIMDMCYQKQMEAKNAYDKMMATT